MIPSNSTNPKICTRCILPETFPGIKFDDNGICNHCRREESAVSKLSEKKEEYRKRLDDLINESRDKAPVYDAIMAYSGGKDSSYTLKLLKEKFNLRLLALTFDNHFVSPAAWENIHKVVDALNVDLICFRPPWDLIHNMFMTTAKADIYPAPTLLRASAICTTCIGLVKSIVHKTALEMSIPLAAFGWSPGQAPIQSAIMQTNPALIRMNQSAMKKVLIPEFGPSIKNYFIPDAYYETHKSQFPYNIHPLAFFDYDENNIISQLKEIGWQAPKDTDTNSSNCLINAFANDCHQKRHKFHPYVWEIANMVRQGVMSREDGIQKIYSEQSSEMIQYAKERLGL